MGSQVKNFSTTDSLLCWKVGDTIQMTQLAMLAQIVEVRYQDAATVDEKEHGEDTEQQLS